MLILNDHAKSCAFPVSSYFSFYFLATYGVRGPVTQRENTAKKELLIKRENQAIAKFRDTKPSAFVLHSQRSFANILRIHLKQTD